ncbi:MAG: PspC domain-containing protein [Deltaproteobacteria bacterium]|nr:PspC domain-containing protein [Deltaproteobacteria bacterium]
MGGTGILLYLICWIIIPQRKTSESEFSFSSSPLRRSRTNCKIAGICGGLGERLDIDPVMVRAGFLFLAITSLGLGIILYLILWAIIPQE